MKIMYTGDVDVSDDMQSQAKALADPSRFRLFRHIVGADGPVGVAELTELLGFNHNAIRQHLLVLRDAGLISETTEDRKVRGRPRKQYVARDDALNAFGSVSGSYEQLAALLLEVITTEAEPYDVGRKAASGPLSASQGLDEEASVIHRLRRQLTVAGFEPTLGDQRTITLENCPFAEVAAIRPGVVCELHRGLIDGFLAANDPDLEGKLDPRDPHSAGCEIVVLRSSAQPSAAP